MNTNFKLTSEQNERFCKLAEEKKDLLMKAMIRLNIPKKSYRDFFNFALEGLLVSFLILEAGDIDEKDFDSFAFKTIKGKLIDEIRRRNRDKALVADYLENTKLNSVTSDTDILLIELTEYLKGTLTDEEFLFAYTLLKTHSIAETVKKLNLSKSNAYRLHKKIKSICETFLKKNN